MQRNIEMEFEKLILKQIKFTMVCQPIHFDHIWHKISIIIRESHWLNSNNVYMVWSKVTYGVRYQNTSI